MRHHCGTGDGTTSLEITFIQHEEGRFRPNGSEMIYEYNLTDHLGNTRITFGDADADGLADILQENHYYPFGMAMTMSSTLAAAPPNNYLYNGKELQDELDLGWYDYGARMYDASIGRWNGVDALAEKFFQYSSYDYVGGNPVIRIDIDGRDWYQFGDKIRWIESSEENLTMNGDDWKNVGAAIDVTVEYSDGSSYNWLGGDDGSVTYFADEVEISAERTSSTQEENHLVEFGNSMTFSMISAGASGGTVKASDILLRSSRYGNQN